VKLLMGLLFLFFLVGCGDGVEVERDAYSDPDKVFDEALQAHKDGKYEEALRKHIWFHQYALDYQLSLSGVRLSYALSDWRCLGTKYPDALVALEYFVDKAEDEIKDGGDIYSIFHDFESINEVLGNEERTIALFEWLDRNDGRLAEKVSNLARQALIDAEKYTLVGKYLDSERELDMQLMQLDVVSNFDVPGAKDGEMEAYAYETFSEEIQTMVAILAKNGRLDEIERVSRKVEEKWNNEDFRAQLELARRGVFPERKKNNSACCCQSECDDSE